MVPMVAPYMWYQNLMRGTATPVRSKSGLRSSIGLPAMGPPEVSV